MVDDQGYGELTPHGAPADRTPALNTFANQGLLFTDGYAVASVCSPTRGGMLTGLYCENVGHRLNITLDGTEGQGLSPTFKTYMDRLASVGYKNYWVGKWFAGSSLERQPLYRGADRFFTISDRLTHTAGNDTLQEDWETIGQTTQYLTDHMGDRVVEYIGDHLANYPEKPFHVHWSEWAPHGPFNADPARLERLFGVKGSYSLAERIAGMNLAIDDNMQKLMDYLDDPDGDPSTDDSIADNTLIVYTNDNGGTPDHANGVLRGGKGDQYEGGIRVPLIVRWPDELSPATYSGPTHMLDWIATFCQVAGVPANERSQLDGLDLMPYLRGAEPHPNDRPLFWNLWPRWYNDTNPATPTGPGPLVRGSGRDMAGGMRQGDWKLMVSENLVVTELYDLSTDPGESTNVKATNMAVHDDMFETYLKWQRTHVVPQWQDGLNTNVYSRDSGMYLRALSNSYRLSNREATPKYFTAEARPFYDLTRNLEAVATITPRSTNDLNASSKAWLVFGFTDPAPATLGQSPRPPNRGELFRAGIDFGASLLVVEDLDTATSSSIAMPSEWVPSEGVELSLSYIGATREMTVSAEGVSTSITLPAGIDAWQNFGFGVESCEVECFLLRDTADRSAASIDNLQVLAGDQIFFNLEFLFPSNRSVRVESSADLNTFTPADDALIERYGPGDFRVWMDIEDDAPRRFFRGVD